MISNAGDKSDIIGAGSVGGVGVGAEGVAINPSGGFKHFGIVKGEYMILRGSVPGVPKRLVKLRQPLRSPQKKIIEPKILEVVIK
jgi:large subunit ribosomal protein L3